MQNRVEELLPRCSKITRKCSFIASKLNQVFYTISSDTFQNMTAKGIRESVNMLSEEHLKYTRTNIDEEEGMETEITKRVWDKLEEMH